MYFVQTTVIFGETAGSPPRFKQKPLHDVVALVDGTHQFLCKVTGSPEPSLHWYRGNEMMVPDRKIKIGKYSMQIFNLNKNDSGDYACKASNTYGELWGNFSLQVIQDEDDVKVPDQYQDYESVDEWADLKGPPEFKKRLHQVAYLARAVTTTVDFDCAVKAYPQASITWLKDGQQVKERKWKYTIQNFKLTVEKLTLGDKGNYTCIVRNEYGSVNWTTKLDVRQRVAIAPILKDVKNKTAVVGDNVIFTCQIVQSDSQPLLQWLRHFKKNDSFVNEKGEHYVKVLQESGFQRTIDDPQHLVLRNVTKEDQGWYTCLVANTVGMDYRSAWLNVLTATEWENLKENDNGTTSPSSKMD